MPSGSGVGYVDYVLWGDDGLPLAWSRRRRRWSSPQVGQQQAKLYADCLEAESGQRPVIFYSNGYEHWLWDDTQYPPRQVQGFYTKDELALLIQRRTIDGSRWRRSTSTTRSSSATTSTGPSGRSPSTSRPTSSARRCW